MQVELEVNGNRHRVDVPAAEPLSAVLRDRLELTGTKVACGEGTCGSCTVLVDDRPVLSCLTLAAACDGASVRTVEADGELLDRLRRAFTDGGRLPVRVLHARPADVGVGTAGADAAPQRG